jgi:hypothetical protein
MIIVYAVVPSTILIIGVVALYFYLKGNHNQVKDIENGERT